MGTDILLDFMKHFDPEYSQRDPRVLEAILRVDRKLFLDDEVFPLIVVDTQKWFAAKDIYVKIVINGQFKIPDELRQALDSLFRTDKIYLAEVSGLAYSNHALPIGNGNKETSSEPSVVAKMADILDLREGLNVLEGGTGYGYHAVVTAYLIGETGRLVSVEINPRLAQAASKNLKAQFGDGIEQRIRIIEGDIMQSVETLTPNFDRIYLTAAVDSNGFDIGKLTNRLREGNGTILFPETRRNLVWKRYEGGVQVDERTYSSYEFVPLQKKDA
ncbi:MAG: rRNA adenine N-6-methyltransferase family protein [Nanoarchaeota archaeon]